jgi:hypothetical protein
MNSFVKGQIHQHPCIPIQKHSAIIFGIGQPSFGGILRNFFQDSPGIWPNLFSVQILPFLVRILLNTVR